MSYIQQIGKIGKINMDANHKLKEEFQDLGVISCEICGSEWALSWHHRHKRQWYRGKEWLLSDIRQVLLLCPNHHDMLERSRALSNETFKKYRSQEHMSYLRGKNSEFSII